MRSFGRLGTFAHSIIHHLILLSNGASSHYYYLTFCLGATCHEQNDDRPSRYLSIYLVLFNSITDCCKITFFIDSVCHRVRHRHANMTKRAMGLDFIWTQNQIENWLNSHFWRGDDDNDVVQGIAATSDRSRNLENCFCSKWTYMAFDSEYDRCTADSVT